MRKFKSGATRDSKDGKPDYAGFLSPLVIRRYGQYMMKHMVQADGKMRSSDNWKKGIPREAYMSSMFRHFMDVWSNHQELPTEQDMQEALCATLFNVMGYLFEVLKEDKK